MSKLASLESRLDSLDDGAVAPAEATAAAVALTDADRLAALERRLAAVERKRARVDAAIPLFQDELSPAIIETARDSDEAAFGVQMAINMAQGAVMLPSLSKMKPHDNPEAIRALKRQITDLRNQRTETNFKRTYALWCDEKKAMVETCDANFPFSIVLTKGYDLKRPYEHVADVLNGGGSIVSSNLVPPRQYVELIQSLGCHVVPFHTPYIIHFQLWPPPTVEVD